MHRRIGADLLPLDTELEKIIKNLKKERVAAEASIMADEREANQNVLVVAVDRPQQRQRTMEDFWRLIIRDEYSAIRQPAIKANNFELKLALIIMV